MPSSRWRQLTGWTSPLSSAQIYHLASLPRPAATTTTRKSKAASGSSPRDVWEVCEALKILWRQAHPKIVAGWKDLEWAVKRAIENPGTITQVANGRLKFKVEGQWLVMRLPSGRKVRYFQPRVRDDRIVYQGVDTDTRQWGWTSTYGGKICENEDQAGCRDLLAGTMLDFENELWPVVMHVHDEPVLEVHVGDLTDEFVQHIMCKVPSWAEGFPLAIEGHRGRRYRK